MKSIALNGKYGKGKTALVSDDDYDELNRYKWVVSSYGYAVRSGYKELGYNKLISMHRQVLKTEASRVDHKDHNTLNNQRGNLRPATQQQNLRNRSAQTNSRSGFKGVCQINSLQRKKHWIAQIKINGKQTRLGYFATQEEAAHAYNQAAIKYFGEYAWLNTL